MERLHLYQSSGCGYHIGGCVHTWTNPIVKKPSYTKVYAVFDTYDEESGNDDYTLRAVKILGVLYTETTYNCLLKVKVAGLGEGWITFKNAYLYASKEDYMNNKTISTNEMFNGEEFNYLNAIEDLARKGQCELNRDEKSVWIYRYAWENNAPKATIPVFFVEYNAITDNFVVYIDPVRGKNFPYGTKAMAIADNEVDVCDFDDDDVKPTTYNLDVTISATIKVSAKNLSDANYKVLEMVKETSFANYHCVETRPKEY